MLFITALCAIYYIKQWKQLLVLVTAFTIGHSITLALATLNLVTINAELVEFLIPVTILLASIVNIIPMISKRGLKKLIGPVYLRNLMLDARKKITIVALQGSVRPENNTGKALAVAKRFTDEHLEVDLKIIDPTGLTLPLPGRGTSEDARWIQSEVSEADAIILATPEYHGSYSSVMSQFRERQEGTLRGP